MSGRWVILFCLLISPWLIGCQSKRPAQAHVHEVWEYGDPIAANHGYYKGQWQFRYDQVVLFDEQRYKGRSTTFFAWGLNIRRWDAYEFSGRWKRDADGMPMLRQEGGGYKRLDAIYPEPDPATEPYSFPPGSPAAQNRLRQTYKVRYGGSLWFPSDSSSDHGPQTEPEKPKPDPERPIFWPGDGAGIPLE